MACFPPCRDTSRSARKLVPRRVQGNDFAFGVLDNRSVRGFDRMMLVFERMFGSGSTREQRLERMQADKSLLDGIMSSALELKRGLGPEDRERISAYLDARAPLRCECSGAARPA